MILKSLGRYLRYSFITCFARKERALLWRNITSYISGAYKNASYGVTEKKAAMDRAAHWLLNNQQFQKDKGFSTYYIVDGHTSSYPETSGYIIDSLFAYSQAYLRGDLQPLLDCADWLVSIQKESGGWQAGYVDAGKPEVVFNTGQVMRGLMKAFELTKKQDYLDACIRAGNWLCSIQEMDGSWQTMASMQAKRTYDSYVAAPLVQLYLVTGDEKYRIAAEKNIYWIIDTQQQKNYWFANADNTLQYNHKPILHTIAYTIDGMLDAGLMLKNDVFITSATNSADVVLNMFQEHKALNGRYDKNWHGSQYMICTGCAQMSIIWSKLYKHTHEKKYREAADKMNNQLIHIQGFTRRMGVQSEGALQGSFPVWGKYEPFAFPNWATKYLLDALMLELGL
ncbi:MAG: glycoside hydrolase family 127 protein [Bacteroidetes bacterium]|nr:glycoside hydrolase family 127 protein [Bacteroidota bacterium]